MVEKTIDPLVKNTFNWVLKEGEKPKSWREAFITAIPKEGKDKLECTNYKPVGVLNLDYIDLLQLWLDV